MRAIKNRRPGEASGDGEQRLFPACRDCGCAVMDEFAHIETIDVEYFTAVVQAIGRAPVEVIQHRPRKVRVSRCRDCELRRRRAGELMALHPGAAANLRHQPMRVDAADSALISFDAIGHSWHDLLAEGSDRQVNHMIQSLMYAGGGARYAMRLRGGVKESELEGVPAGRERWTHLAEPQRAAVRDAFGEYLADRIDGPVAVPIPEDDDWGTPAMRGCLFCGVHSVVVPSRRVKKPWGEMRKARASLLGGPGEPGYREGFLCPECNKAFERIGAIGMTALEFALATHLGLPPEVFEKIDAKKLTTEHQQGFRLGFLKEIPKDADPNAYEMEPVKAWCALPVGTPPNVKPWAHLGDLSELREALQKL